LWSAPAARPRCCSPPGGSAPWRSRSSRRTTTRPTSPAHTYTRCRSPRRPANLYTKSVEQLGSEKAPVRLGGLYALERLAQDHFEQRQTIVNVLCAYLRMPYTLPGEPPVDDTDDKLITAHRERAQEREVRLAAQRILGHHLRPGDDRDNPAETFWVDIDLDLTGATLIDLDLDRCTTRRALFVRATFTGMALFDRATFTGLAGFADATFTGSANFRSATFTGIVLFDQATFTSIAKFDQATFTSHACFERVTFTGSAGFHGVTFTQHADFGGAALPSTRFGGRGTPSPWTDFSGARFAREVPDKVARFVASPAEEAGEDRNVPGTE
jgi:uncharacterized protein YjbI with pentapeptide repeats